MDYVDDDALIRTLKEKIAFRDKEIAVLNEKIKALEEKVETGSMTSAKYEKLRTEIRDAVLSDFAAYGRLGVDSLAPASPVQPNHS